MQILILWSFMDLFLKTEEAVAFPKKIHYFLEIMIP